jgi:hypothetical protein
MPGSATYTIAGQPVDEGAVLRFHTPLVGHVAETPDTAADLVGEPLGARVALHHPAVGEHDLVEALGAWVGIQIAHLRQERLRVDELPQDEREREVVVAGRHHLVGDPPHLHETLVRRDDPALEVDDEDPVGGGLERGAQQRAGELRPLLLVPEVRGFAHHRFQWSRHAGGRPGAPGQPVPPG